MSSDGLPVMGEPYSFIPVDFIMPGTGYGVHFCSLGRRFRTLRSSFWLEMKFFLSLEALTLLKSAIVYLSGMTGRESV